jgi:hypothetical protein
LAYDVISAAAELPPLQRREAGRRGYPKVLGALGMQPAEGTRGGGKALRPSTVPGLDQAAISLQTLPDGRLPVVGVAVYAA